MEKTFVMIKPDGVKELIGEILKGLKQKALNLRPKTNSSNK